LVSGDAGGTGKFLKLNFEGDGTVTATKVKSGEIRTFYSDDPTTYTQKVGAGTVELFAIPNDGWDFSHWIGDVADTQSILTDYKTVKYGEITAVFEKISYTITVIVPSGANNGHVETTVDGVLYEIYDIDYVTVEAESSPTFYFFPDTINDHVSAIKLNNDFILDENSIPYQESFTLPPVQMDITLTVFFNEDGEAFVPGGSDVPVYLGESVSLNFDSTPGGGTATQAIIELIPQLFGTSLILWDVSVYVSFNGIVEIALPYEGTETIQYVFMGDSVDALYSDVNSDGLINGDDVSDVANAIRTLVPNGIYDPAFDVDRNGVLDEHDVHIVNENKGAILTSLYFWIEGNILYIETDHFSIFRAR
jgi:hypothetical protein